MSLAELVEPVLFGAAFTTGIEAGCGERALLLPPGENLLGVVDGGDGASVGVGRDLELLAWIEEQEMMTYNTRWSSHWWRRCSSTRPSRLK